MDALHVNREQLHMTGFHPEFFILGGEVGGGWSIAGLLTKAMHGFLVCAWGIVMRIFLVFVKIHVRACSN